MPDFTRQEFLKLVEKFNAGKASAEEAELLDRYYALFGDLPEVSPDQAQESRMLKNIHQNISPGRKFAWMKYAAAASIVIALSAGAYFSFRKPVAPQQTAQLIKNDIAPGHHQATLTLANGKKILLTKGLSGLLAQQGNTQIQVSQNDITYTNGQPEQQVSYNTLTTARGEQSPYPLVLPDGTKVWLNAESSITFPTAFTGKERVVKVTGEALFEVAHNASQPFKVQTDKQTIEDIGTTFDVNAYADEPHTTTTLVEGKVKVGDLTLTPGQQTDGNHIKNVNVKRFTAWKNGDFDFDGENIQTIMRQLARWYNIDVHYEGTISNDGLTAQITRNRNISGILHILQNTQTVHFKIEGRSVTVIE